MDAMFLVLKCKTSATYIIYSYEAIFVPIRSPVHM